MQLAVPEVQPRRGRPRKFTAPSRAVTITLPVDVLATLASVDTDLSRSIVRLAQPEVAKRPHPAAELATYGRRGVIVVNPSRTLEKRTGIVLVPLSDGRALISFDDSITAAGLELLIQDALEDPALPAHDARIFKSIQDILKSARRSGNVVLAQRNIIVLEFAAARRARSGAQKRRR